MDKIAEFATVSQICAQHGIEIQSLRSTTGSFGKRIFFINDEYLLRVSATTMAGEQARFRRVAELQNVPHIQYLGLLERKAGPIHYTLLTLLPGKDFVEAYGETTSAQQRQLGKAVAAFLDDLHACHGTCYDIGLYVPAIPGFSGTWREGHQRYWEELRTGTAALPLQPASQRIIAEAFRFMSASADVLDYQAGPVVLHNDFHPRNILLDKGSFSGVIDWECSQYGEADFELCHLIHWCLYPPSPDIDFRAFLSGVWRAAPRCTQVPELPRRLTLYQLEHDIQLLIWQGSAAEAERVPRLACWLAGGVEQLLQGQG